MEMNSSRTRNQKKFDFKEIVKHFAFDGDFLEAYPHGSGHINDTYIVWFRKTCKAKHRYILQRINHNVFKDPNKLMQNIKKITTHLREKIIVAHGDPDRETINIVPTTGGHSFYMSPDGNYWRAYLFIENAQAYQITENLKYLYNASKAFGRFQEALLDFPVKQLHKIIPDLHYTPGHFRNFVEALERDIILSTAYF